MSEHYAVIGNPIAHSRSPAIHALFAKASGQDIVYGRLLAPVDAFAEAVARFRDEGGRGLNVTLPFKREAFELATQRTARAEAAGAVNTLTFEDGQIRGDNTDGVGLVRDIETRVGEPLAGRSVLLLGAGGAAGGVVQPLLEAGVSRLVIANRSAERAVALAQRGGDDRLRGSDPRMGGADSRVRGSDPRVRGGGFGLVDELLADGGRFDVLVNATSSGLAGDRLPLPNTLFAQACLAYDMFYAAAQTPFMEQASAGGCPKVCDGLGMLIEQAAESFFVWRGIRPVTSPVYAALRAELAAQAAR